MSIQSITARTYSGCYGGETTNIADGIVVNITCPIQKPSMKQKQIIFVVDESGSMGKTMPSVKASLFASRNAIIKLLQIEDCDTEADRDEIFTQHCNSTIITFSERAHYKWESVAACNSKGIESKNVPFGVAVNKLAADSATNLGDGIKMAFSSKLEGYATWIIILTDGVPNKGDYQTPEAFFSLMCEMPPNTKIIPLGYTTLFDPDILSILGTMTYVDSEEAIAETLGSIMGEIVTAYGMNAKITLPTLAQSTEISPLTDDTIIVAPDIISLPREIIGTKNIGCLYNERKYIYGYLPWGSKIYEKYVKLCENRPLSTDHDHLLLSRYDGLQGELSYYDIVEGVTISIPFKIEYTGLSYPDNICEAYFEASKSRIILSMYQTKKNGFFNRKYVDCIKDKLEDWKHPKALSHKQEILRLLNNLSKCSNLVDYIGIIGLASSTQNQTSYTNTGRYSTNTQRIASASATIDYRNIYSQPISNINTSLNLMNPVTIDRNLLNNVMSDTNQDNSEDHPLAGNDLTPPASKQVRSHHL